MDDWIKVISFTYPHEAHLAKGFLESENIEVIIVDELTVQVNPFYSNAIGGVKLYVESCNVNEALSLLESGGYIDKSPVSGKIEIEEFSIEYVEICPYCNSENVTKNSTPGYVFVFSLLLLGFPFPFLKKVYHCYDCRKEWKIKAK